MENTWSSNRIRGFNIFSRPREYYRNFSFAIRRFTIGQSYEATPVLKRTNCKRICLFDLGKPKPRVAWFLESQIIDAPSEIRETQGPEGETNVVTISNVTLKGLTRSHYHAKLFCKASNTPLAPPPTTTVVIELHSKYSWPVINYHTTVISTR